MNYPEELREKWNDCMYDERDIIEKFLKDQYDLRYGHQRDTWHFEDEIEVVSSQGSLVKITDIMLDKDCFVKFHVKAFGHDYSWWECFNFAYGELSKVIEALPDAEKIVRDNAVEDLKVMTTNLRIDYLLADAPFKYEVNGKFYTLDDVKCVNGTLSLVQALGNDTPASDLPTEVLVGLRDHINIEVLHRSEEYKNLVGLLDNFDNKAFNFVEHKEFPSAKITILGTDMELSVFDVCKVEDGSLVIYACTDSEEDIYLYDKDIRPEYLFDIIKVVKEHAVYDIMDTLNAHNPELVRKINDAWKKEGYHKLFGTILLALLYRDNMEYEQKFGEILDYSEEYAMEHAHEIMEGVCDDQDLETILSFIRYEE